MLFEKLIRPALYRLSKNDPEAVHERTLRLLGAWSERTSAGKTISTRVLSTLRNHYRIDDPVEVFGLRFPNRMGLAAGMDKDGRALTAWPALGFGFVEVGTVTYHAQPGNPRPRLFALPESGAIINRMGFNNSGAQALAKRLAQQPKAAAFFSIPLGISIGKSKITPVEEAIGDYRKSLQTLYSYADYFAINVSSPNTPGLRSLQDRAALSDLLAELRKASATLAGIHQRKPIPLLVKVAPDLSESALEEVLEVCESHEISGIIATNTTLSRDGLQGKDIRLGSETGGLSGKPLTARRLEIVHFIHQRTNGKIPVIGVGGIFSADDAKRTLDAGATLLQIYTGFALSGPGLIRRINQELARS